MAKINELSSEELQVLNAFGTLLKKKHGSISAVAVDLTITLNDHIPTNSVVTMTFSDGTVNTAKLSEILWMSNNLPPAPVIFQAVKDRQAGKKPRPFTPTTQGRRDFRPVTSPTQPTTAGSAGGSIAVAQLTWATARKAVLDRVEGDKRRRFFADFTENRPRCKCIQATTSDHGLCDHILLAYYQMEDRPALQTAIGNGQRVRIPIGMGYLMPEFTVMGWMGRDTGTHYEPPLADAMIEISGESLVNIASKVGGEDVSTLKSYRLNPGEGVLPFIRYVEDLVRLAPEYRKLIGLHHGAAMLEVTDNCSRKSSHGPSIANALDKGFASNNPLRLAFTIANVLSLITYARCVPCQRGYDGSGDTPTF